VRRGPAGREVEHDTTRKAVKSDKINILMVEGTLMAGSLLADALGQQGLRRACGRHV
jgi:hypothetical protein